MSLVRMRNTMHDKLPMLMLVLAGSFVVGWIGLVLSSGATDIKDDKSGVLAEVNGRKIERIDFEQRFQAQLLQMGDRSISAFQEAQMRGQLFDSMADRIVREDAAKKEGVRVRNGEVKKKINELIDGQLKQAREQLMPKAKDKSDRALDALLKKRGMSLAQFKDELRAAYEPEAIRDQLLMEKLMKKLEDKVDVSDAAIRASFDEVQFSQITIDTSKRSSAQAEQRAKEIAAKIKGGTSFADAAKQYSEDPYHDKGGTRPFYVRKSYIEKELADKVFTMKKGEVSEPIKLAQNIVIVKLDEKRSALPKDYSDPKKQKEYKDMYVQQQQYALQSQFMSEMQQNTKITVRDHELKAYMATKALSGGMASGPEQAKAKALEAVKELEKAADASNGNPTAMARIYAQLSYLYDWLGQSGMFASSKEETAKYQAAQKKALQTALEYTESTDLRTMMADINIKEGQYAKALEDLEFVSENAFEDVTTHRQLLQRYESLKKHEPVKVAALIAAEKKWIADYEAAEAERMKQQGQTSQPFQVDPNSKPGG